MKLEMAGQMRMEQRMKLAPHMIQSMEILQLPILALQERIEQEINSNPVLELEEPESQEETEIRSEEPSAERDAGTKDLVVDTDNNKLDDFRRLDGLDGGLKEYVEQEESFRPSRPSEEPDSRLQALKNVPAPPQSLHDYLTGQWGLVEAEPAVKKAGGAIIDYIDDRGYLAVRLEQLHNKDKGDFTLEDLKAALVLIQTLEPAGVGARDLKECLLIQIAQGSSDMSFERRLIAEHLDDLLDNRLPEIARKMNCTIERINEAIGRLSKLDTSPGLQVGRDDNMPIRADVIVEREDDAGEFRVRLADSNLPNLRLNAAYTQMTRDTRVSEKTRTFLLNNIRSAQWIIDAIEQRKNTLLKVTKAIVRYQKDFFERGSLYLQPLPMAKVAGEVGVHLATVSRAVAGKYVECSWGMLPLRKFFSGGTEDVEGKGHSWEAIRAKLQQIIDSEDKRHPLSDDQIRERLAEAGIRNLARRTVAKYRKLLNIPTSRFRKKF